MLVVNIWLYPGGAAEGRQLLQQLTIWRTALQQGGRASYEGVLTHQAHTRFYPAGASALDPDHPVKDPHDPRVWKFGQVAGIIRAKTSAAEVARRVVTKMMYPQPFNTRSNQ